MTALVSEAAADLLAASPSTPDAPCITRPVHIIASPFKSATTTVGRALVDLGVGQHDMAFYGKLQRQYVSVFREINNTIERTVSAQDWIRENHEEVRRKLSGLIPHLDRFDIYSDAPFGHTHLHPFARKAVAPLATFIWNHRPKAVWLDSVRRWEISHPKVYPNYTMWESDPEGRAEILTKRWRRHLRQFRRLAEDFPEDCLELRSRDLRNYAALAAFYNVEPISGPLRKHNVSQEG